MTVSRIAVTTDFSDESRRAFPIAASLAKRFHADLVIIHLAQVPPVVLSPWPEVGPYFIPEDVFDTVEKRLADLAQSDPAFAGVHVKPRVVRGERVEALADVLAEDRMDLLVTATHGFSGVKRFFLGSFAERILRTAPCPVLVSREEPAAEFVLRRLYVAHDFSPASRPSLLLAREWAKAFQARVRLHFVVEQSASLYDYAANMQGSFKEYLDRVRVEALERFKRMIREEWKGLEAEASATAGSAEVEILREAKEFGADLIVLGTHSRSGLERFFLGSVTQKVVTRAACPVLTARD